MTNFSSRELNCKSLGVAKIDRALAAGLVTCTVRIVVENCVEQTVLISEHATVNNNVN